MAEGRVTVRLVQDYERDIEWWVAHPADPRFVTIEAGEVLEVSEDEARQMLADGIAEAVE